MITEFILNVLLACADALVSIFPDMSSVPCVQAFCNDEDSTGSAAGVLQSAGNLNYVFPLETFLRVLTCAMLLLVILYTWEVAQWIYHQFWGSS